MSEFQTQSHSVTVDAPVRTVYDQWTQLEEFPAIMPMVEEVVQREDDVVYFRLNILGRRIDYEAKILEQIPEDRIAWRSMSGRQVGGIVRFRALNPEQTQVMLDLRYERGGFLEIVGDELGVVSERIRDALQAFKEFVETRGHATGGWRGVIRHGEVRRPDERRAGRARPTSGLLDQPSEF